MAYFGLLAVLQTLALANAGIIVPSAKILQGPSSRTTLVGPDGSIIDSFQPGGQVITDNHATLLAHAEPAVVAHASPVIAAKTIIPTHAEVHAVHAPLVAAPVVSVHAAPLAKAVVATPVVTAHVAPVAAVAVVGSKTTISQHSQSIIHPSPAAKVYSAPVLAAQEVAAVVAAPVTPVEAAVVTADVTPVEAAPVAAAKSVVVENSGAEAAHDAVVVNAEAAPAVTAHAAPVISAHVVPAIATKTVVSEHANTVVSHSAPVVGVHHIPVVTAYAAPAVVGHPVGLVAGRALGHESTVVSGPSGYVSTAKHVPVSTVIAHHGIHH